MPVLAPRIDGDSGHALLIVALRLGLAQAAALAAKARESVRLCEECGACASRCL